MTTFAEARPDLAKYYKPELNGGKLMSEFAKTNPVKIVLCCDKCGAIRKVQLNSYTHKSRLHYQFKCYKCNSFGKNFPDLLQEWDYDKNDTDPFSINKYSPQKVWWKCPKNHSWEAQVHKRTKTNRGCPSCKISKGEQIIADWLSENNIKYFVQYSFGLKKFDFYIPEEKIFVEVHGEQHFKEHDFFTRRSLKEEQKSDQEKQAYAESHGTYIMVDYREHKPELVLERFIDALAELA